MQFLDCTRCGEYGYIKEDGLCPDCYNTVHNIDNNKHITGEVVLDTGTKEPIENAVVSVHSQLTCHGSFKTDKNGKFDEKVPSDSTHITINIRGCVSNKYPIYTGDTQDIQIDQNISVEFDAQNTVETEVDGDPVEIIFRGKNNTDLIYNIEQLQSLSKSPNGSNVIIEDIDAKDTRNWNGGRGFKPIEQYTGALFGNGKRIEGLCIDRPDDSHVGLIDENEGIVRDLQLHQSEITGGKLTGAVAGVNNGDMRFITVGGNISSDGANVGGVAGSNIDYDSRILGCEVYGEVTGAKRVGGLTGYNGGMVRSSFARNDVISDEIVGGLVGETSGRLNFTGIVRDSYCANYVVGNTDVGGIIGRSEDGLLSALYWNRDNQQLPSGVGSSKRTVNEVYGLRTNQMKGKQAQSQMSELRWGNPWVTSSEYPTIEK